MSNAEKTSPASNKKTGNAKISLFGELSLMSVSASIGLLVIVILSFCFYVFMSSSPDKKVIVDDEADIFTRDEIAELEDKAESLSRAEDINVVIVTTRDKGRGYSNSDEDCAKFAADYYGEHCIRTSLVNNSGICILIDLTLDEPGQRFFWIYTYGTAYFAIDDDECVSLFNSQRSLLSSGDYYGALNRILRDLKDYNYSSTGALTFFCLIIPAGIAWVITMIATSSKSLDKKPDSKQYRASKSTLDRKEKVLKSRRIRQESSGGYSGGHSGGGGFGGGGHSGGGGGRF